jgi:hypothetical protein
MKRIAALAALFSRPREVPAGPCACNDPRCGYPATRCMWI